MPHYSSEYRALAKRGPFPGRIDPWAEAGRYFQQIHSGIIDHIITQIEPALFGIGYLVGKEASLQIAEGREPGVLLESAVERQALHIKQSGRLVTVVEIISPTNKTKPQMVADYQERRERLVLEQGVNVVEIDLTRSVKHLLNHPLTSDYAYHIAVYIPGDSPHLIGIALAEGLKRVALPLRGGVIPVELQQAYDYAYQLVTIAAQIDSEGNYAAENLPFPSLLGDQEQHEALQAISRWRSELADLNDKNQGYK